MAEAVPDQVRLTGMRFSAIHGVYAFEREQPQTFIVDLICHLRPRPNSDELNTTVDYAELSRAVAEDVMGEPLNLIESVAERVAATCLRLPLIRTVEVTVHKPNAQMPVELTDVAVTIIRSRTP